jgi:hypothetical protein
MKKLRHILRQSVIVILALQFLNLSVNNPALYEYSYTNASLGTQTGTDPTETALEMILEAKYGQMDIFTYKTNPESNKNVFKILCFHFDLINYEPATPLEQNTPASKSYIRDEKIVTVTQLVKVPPPRPIQSA